ncbi:DUF2004 domain-containing protein [Picrophilus oshimae]|uniref:DUF2004 domain-containing protein n=1 Tax=Picrophilus torridus (strain ATCC 700027 / DSM 9790 / JCM 10055 / NBRC 100828 / KAW 2/3) TaxID=1122961 RepID=Q6L1D2_PICTO|nr:DUF2004 domain-containing protein [Picrophilus oshimae]AAT43220.1 hypothetical protein PTO0635 [Picrophilus oshimae DSM 9789]SMD30475.1 Protein of unknown function [Picrophilus oshimae DSM 9789]
MSRGLEISFQLNDNDEKIVFALANITGNDFLIKDKSLKWLIFHVTLGEHKFYKILYSGKKINDLHPGLKEGIRKEFDDLSKLEYNELMNKYNEMSQNKDFIDVKNIKEVTEEYDLWQDPLWNYI